MAGQNNLDPALTAIIERDDELRQIVAKAEALGKFRDALRGISVRVELVVSRAQLVGLLGSAKKGARPKPNYEVRYDEAEIEEDPKSREKMEEMLGLRPVSKPTS